MVASYLLAPFVAPPFWPPLLAPPKILLVGFAGPDRKGVGMKPKNWLRIDCPACGAWLGVPGDTPSGPRAQRVARRIDAFLSRHTHHKGAAT